LPCNTNTNGEYGEWRSSSKPAFGWQPVLELTCDQVRCPGSKWLLWLLLNGKNSWKDTKFLATKTLSAWQMASWKTKNENSCTMESELWRNHGPSAFQLQENMSKSDEIWSTYLVVNCVGLRTFWTPLVHIKWVLEERKPCALPSV